MTHDETIFAQYAKHSDVLRNWFVAYGIGGVVLFLSKQEVFSSVPKPTLSTIAIWFLLGVISQVVLAFINKIYNFILYSRTQEPEKKRFQKNLRAFFLIDFPFDLLTAISYAKATYDLFTALK